MGNTIALPDWSALLVEAVTKPGIISAAYSRFWNYSPGNQILAIVQCYQRSLEPGPINTFCGWRDLGRFVRRGEQAITLCMPVTVKQKVEKPPTDSSPDDGTECPVAQFTRFLYRPNWFVLSQTAGKEYVPTALPTWTEADALQVLSITHVPFTAVDGNALGYASQRHVAISPLADLPHKTLFHELAHVVLGHTQQATVMVDGAVLSRSTIEVEAEAVALICCESLGMPGADQARGYIQHWLGTETITERTAQRIFKAADAVLKAGRPTAAPSPIPTT